MKTNKFIMLEYITRANLHSGGHVICMVLSRRITDKAKSGKFCKDKGI